MKEEIIIQDEDVTVLMPKKAITKGHMIVVPNNEFVIMEQVPDKLMTKLFQLSNKLSSILFDNLGCQGTNILIQNGVPAGQIEGIFSINIIPRFENDKIDLEWTPGKSSEEELNTVLGLFSKSEQDESSEKIVEEKKKKLESSPEEEIAPDDKNYLLKSLKRLP